MDLFGRISEVWCYIQAEQKDNFDKCHRTKDLHVITTVLVVEQIVYFMQRKLGLSQLGFENCLLYF